MNSENHEVVEIPDEQRTRCKVYARVVGFIRPIDNWNDAKTQEFRRREVFDEKVAFK